MRHKTARYLPVFVLAFSAMSASRVPASNEGVPRFDLEFEAGVVWQSRNDVQIPNNASGTRFSLVDVAGNGPFPAWRLYLTWNVNMNHGVRILFAPLTIKESALLGEAVSFSGKDFEAGVPSDATYTFNSYRITYRYRFYRRSRFDGWIGFTAKIRDAKIKIEQTSVSAEKTDVGFVPLLHLGGRYRFTDRWRILLDLDALAGGPGRAEDLSLTIQYGIRGGWSISGGYRTVEGGADVEEVYNFAWLHYAVLAAELRF